MYKVGAKVNLVGYTSTSKFYDIAYNFAFENKRDGMLPVIFEIDFQSSIGLFEMTDDISAYPGEFEVLVQDGLVYEILAV